MDRYAYVNNAPVNLTDPSGHMVSDGMNGEGGGCDRQCWGERNPPPASKPPKGRGGGSSDEDASSLGEVFGGSKGPVHDIIDSGGDTNVGYEIRSDGLMIVTYYGAIKAFDISAGVDTRTRLFLDAFMDSADLRKEEMQKLDGAIMDFIWKGVAAIGIVVSTGLGYVSAPTGFGVPVAFVGTIASGYAAYEVYKSGMEWGDASVNLYVAESNAQATWNGLNNLRQ